MARCGRRRAAPERHRPRGCPPPVRPRDRRACAALLVSLEADVYPRHYPERAELIEGSIGELSMFHETFGYYADGVGVHTATLLDG